MVTKLGHYKNGPFNGPPFCAVSLIAPVRFFATSIPQFYHKPADTMSSRNVSTCAPNYTE
jgi:hypothetical protein